MKIYSKTELATMTRAQLSTIQEECNAIIEKVKNGKEVKRYRKINITFGIADEYYDYSF